MKAAEQRADAVAKAARDEVKAADDAVKKQRHRERNRRLARGAMAATRRTLARPTTTPPPIDWSAPDPSHRVG